MRPSGEYGTRSNKVNVLQAYYTYGYGRSTLMATCILCSRLQAYDAYGYGCTTLAATGVLGLRLQAYLADGRFVDFRHMLRCCILFAHIGPPRTLNGKCSRCMGRSGNSTGASDHEQLF